MTMKERILIWIAWHIPKELAKWVFVRVAVSNTGDLEVPGITITEALDRWV